MRVLVKYFSVVLYDIISSLLWQPRPKSYIVIVYGYKRVPSWYPSQQIIDVNHSLNHKDTYILFL